MATTTTILFTFLFLLISTQIQAQNSSAPAPTSTPTTNLTGILDKAGQYTTFIRLLTSTQVSNQIENQINSSTEGLTVFAPTDNAFNNLKAGALNGLTTQQQVTLVLYHVLPKYYSLTALQTVSNPVRTQASGQDGGVYGLNFTGEGSQVNVSTGIVETQIYNPLRQSFPLAVYEVDKVLLPEELFGAKAPAKAPPPATSTPSDSNTTTGSSGAPSSSTPPGSDAGSVRGFSMGVVVGLGLICMGVVF